MRISLLLLLVSCGKHTLLTMPEIDLNYDKGGRKDSEPTNTQVSMAVVTTCNMQALNNRCTYQMVYNRALNANELFNNYCLNNYRQCTRR